MSSILLCTFANASDIKLIIDYIQQNYELDRGTIYIFHNENNIDDLYCTYNVVSVDHFIENTILIHRKKETNTLYTINALNQIIRGANNGIVDKTFVIDWESYTNSILLTVDQTVRVIPLQLKAVVRKK